MDRLHNRSVLMCALCYSFHSHVKMYVNLVICSNLISLEQMMVVYMCECVHACSTAVWFASRPHPCLVQVSVVRAATFKACSTDIWWQTEAVSCHMCSLFCSMNLSCRVGTELVSGNTIYLTAVVRIKDKFLHLYS